MLTFWLLQSKKMREEEAQRELDALFGMAIKQPKVPTGEPLSRCRVSTVLLSTWMKLA